MYNLLIQNESQEWFFHVEYLLRTLAKNQATKPAKKSAKKQAKNQAKNVAHNSYQHNLLNSSENRFCKNLKLFSCQIVRIPSIKR